MIETVMRCDECLEIKKKTNHWWLIIPCMPDDQTFKVGPFNVIDAVLPGAHAYCGTDHFQKALLRGLTTGSLENPANNAST